MQPALEPNTAQTGERSNWEILSVVRFFLALIVALTHVGKYAPGIGAVGLIAAMCSFEAVMGFLLISGYSIGKSIQKEPRGFLLRRMLRIYPLYLAALLLNWFVKGDALTGSFAVTFLINALFLNQIFAAHSYLEVGWSLSLEIWLYCLAPFFIRLSERSLEFLIGFSFLFFALYSASRSLFHMPYYTWTIGGINLPCLGFIWISGFYLARSSPGKARSLHIVGRLFWGSSSYPWPFNRSTASSTGTCMVCFSPTSLTSL